MMYAAKCYWPGVTRIDVEQIAALTAQAGLGMGRSGVAYLGSLLFAADDLVLCLFEGPSRAAVIQASDRIGIPRERLMDSAWLGLPIQEVAPPRSRPSGRRAWPSPANCD